MASPVTADFFENGTNKQFEWVLGKYQETLQAKADGKPGKAETLIKLDKWYQNDLPKKIKSRGKEGHLTHEELVQTIKWKLARGVFRPRLKDLIQMNTPRVVMQESKKAFRAIFKRNDLEAAVGALSNLKGVGPAMASAVLAAGCPELAPFMADECLLSMEGTEGIDYTMKEYMKLVAKTQQCVDRLNEQGGSWTPHKVEMAVWTHYVARDLKPEILEDMPSKHEAKADRFNGDIDDDLVIPAVNGEVSGESGPETEVEAEPFKNGVEVTEEVENGEEDVMEDVAAVREVSEEVREPMINGLFTNGLEGSSEVPSEASASSEVSVEVSANGTTNGTYGDEHLEAQAMNNGDRGRVEVAPEAMEPIPIAVVTTKRPLEDAEEVQVAECKRVRESGEEMNIPGMVAAAASSPVPSQQVAPSEVPGMTSCQPPIHTGAD